MAILPVCLAQRKAGMGLIFYKLLRARAVDMDEKHSLDLLTALEAGAHAEQAFELRTLLELRGLATVGDAGTWRRVEPRGAAEAGSRYRYDRPPPRNPRRSRVLVSAKLKCARTDSRTPQSCPSRRSPGQTPTSGSSLASRT